MNLITEIEKLVDEGYSQENAEARLCQDIVLQGIAKSSLSRNVTIKGGVVMRNLSKNIRRATQDVDIDFIRYSLDDNSIDMFLSKINNNDGIQLKRVGRIENLNHQDYKGKRIHILIKDDEDNEIKSKIDIGVHKDLSIIQDEYCFDICYEDEGASLLMNRPSQMISEKLKSIVRFLKRSTRYKDIFDIYYLLEKTDNEELLRCIEKNIFSDETLGSVNSVGDIIKVLESLKEDEGFIKRIRESKKNWLETDEKVILQKIIEQLSILIK